MPQWPPSRNRVLSPYSIPSFELAYLVKTDNAPK